MLEKFINRRQGERRVNKHALTSFPDRRVNPDRRVHHTEPANIFVRRYIVARVYVTLSIFLSIISAMVLPIFNGAPFALLCVSAFICIVGMCDIIINDFCPNDYTIKYAYDNRHLIYMCMSLVSFSLSAGILYADGASIVLVRMWLDGSIAALVAVLDIFARHRGFSWRTTSFP